MTKSKTPIARLCPKFLLVAVVCAIIGGVIGYYSGHSAAKGGLDQLVGMMKEAGAFFGTHIAPWLMLALAVIVPVVCIPIYRRAKKLVAAWDGEDEDISDTVDRKLSAVIWTHKRSFHPFLFSDCSVLLRRLCDI